MSDALRRELQLFGINVVIIEPGTVNTEMYDKGEKEDLSEFKQTEYWEAARIQPVNATLGGLSSSESS
jgi:NAD(P)-dependent dehydrogenase (short-subunit alcohol dehydrogenase family)